MLRMTPTSSAARKAPQARWNPAKAGERAQASRRAIVMRSSSNEPSTSTKTSASPPPPPPILAKTAVVGHVVPFREAATKNRRVIAPKGFPTLVVLPGFGNAAEDYFSPPPTAAAEEERREEEDKGKGAFSSLWSSLFFSSSFSTSSNSFESDDDALLVASASFRPPPPAPPPSPSLASALEARGFSVAVVPVRRSDWFRVARCAVDPAYWKGEAEPETGKRRKGRGEGGSPFSSREKERERGREERKFSKKKKTKKTQKKTSLSTAYGWYLDLAERVVEEAALANSSGVVLLAHSAGGWLGRALVGRSDGNKKSSKSSSSSSSSSSQLRKRVRALCTLGTPHAHNKASCVTGGALAKVNERWPGAFYSSSSSEGENELGIRYVAVAGRAVVGDVSAPRGTAARAAAAAYSQVAGGDGHGVAGDGMITFFFFSFLFGSSFFRQKKTHFLLPRKNANNEQGSSRSPPRRSPGPRTWSSTEFSTRREEVSKRALRNRGGLGKRKLSTFGFARSSRKWETN